MLHVWLVLFYYFFFPLQLSPQTLSCAKIYKCEDKKILDDNKNTVGNQVFYIAVSTILIFLSSAIFIEE